MRRSVEGEDHPLRESRGQNDHAWLVLATGGPSRRRHAVAQALPVGLRRVARRREYETVAVLIGEVRTWIFRNEGAELKGFFFSGGDWTGGPPRRARVRVQSLSDGGPTPDMWAVRYDHVDTEIRARRWTADVSVTQLGAREWRLALELRHELRGDYVGPEPPMPQPSSPRLVTGLLESRHWVCRVGKQRLATQPISLKVGKGHEFERLLRDATRLVPLVLVSCDHKTGVPTLDSVLLSRALAGTGVVICESAEYDDELAHFLPYGSGAATARFESMHPVSISPTSGPLLGTVSSRGRTSRSSAMPRSSARSSGR